MRRFPLVLLLFVPALSACPPAPDGEGEESEGEGEGEEGGGEGEGEGEGEASVDACGNPSSATDHGPGVVTITEDTTLRAADSPHLIQNGVSVDGATLTLEPCALLQFGNAGRGADAIYVNGPAARLIAQGSAAEPIVIEALDANEPAGGIVVAFGSAYLEHVLLRNSGASFDGPGAISVYNDGPRREALRTVSVRIENAELIGVFLEGTGVFTADSTDLEVVGAASLPLRLTQRSLINIPTGRYTGNGDDVVAVVVVSGRGDEDLVLPELGIPYRIEGGDIVLGDDAGTATMMVEAGVTLLLSGAGIVVGGGSALIAAGTPASPIVFTSASATPAAGDWTRFLWIGAIAAENVVDEARLEYGGGTTSLGTLVACFCNSQGLHDCDSESVVVLDERPGSQFITNTTFADVPNHVIQHGYLGSPVDFAATNVFVDVGGFEQTTPPDETDICADTVLCP